MAQITMEEVQNQYNDEIREFFSSLKKIEKDVARIWIKQIETGRLHSEQAIIELANRFNGIVKNLEDAVKASDTSSRRDGRMSVMSVLQGGEKKLNSVVASLEAAMGNRDALLKQVGELVGYIHDLKDMAAAVASLADQTNMLALNAAIEAARAGDTGRGFAVVAGEVRSLSKKSGETGRRISETVKVISNAISEAFDSAETFASQDSARVENAERDIHSVLDDFRQLADYLEVSADVLRNSNRGIKNAIEDSLVHLQFQDRVSQILSHVRDNIGLFPSCIEESERIFREEGRLVAIDWRGLLEELMNSYATHEEHVNHGAPKKTKHTKSNPSDSLTYF